MSTAFALAETESGLPASFPKLPVIRQLRVQAFNRGNQDEVLAFLSQRPVHTVFMAGLIRDNGLVSFANRGTFYGCRDREDRLTGVALVGAKTVIEARTDEAMKMFAELVPNNLTGHLIRGEQHQVDYLLKGYSAAGRMPRQFSKEILLEQRHPLTHLPVETRLRLAHSEDLESVISINAALAFEESGLNPLLSDARGMRARAARRIDQGRVWILVENNRLVFKADVISETPETVFIEGVFVQPDVRRQGYGLSGMTQLGRNLLQRFGSVCLVVNEDNARARAFYGKLGYEVCSAYSTAYFSPV